MLNRKSKIAAANLGQNPLRLLLYLEWTLLGIALLGALGGFIPHPHPHRQMHPPQVFSWLGIFSLALLAIIGLRPPDHSRLMQQAYIISGFMLSWSSALLIPRGERIFPVLLLVVAIRACLLFPWSGRIVVAVLAYLSFLAGQILSWQTISFWGISWGRRLPPGLRRLPAEDLRRVWLNLVFNSALLFAFVLIFVLLLVGAVIAEHHSKAKLTQAHRRLQQYALKIENQATLQERNRIAREIHDSVGHYLTAQSIQLENTALFLDRDLAKAASHLVKARQLGKDALANIRTSVATLRTNPLKEQSLSSLIEQLIADFRFNTNIKIVNKIELNSNLSDEVSISLFRIIQEILTNITKHSQATEVTLNLKQDKQKILLSIHDNGCGFDPSNNTTGFGLQGIQERTAALQGKIKITSKSHQGCQINLAIPLL
ncbi:MAG: sensor histidine kinase [Cyanobacteria bacterium P01_G01_bin.39]